MRTQLMPHERSHRARKKILVVEDEESHQLESILPTSKGYEVEGKSSTGRRHSMPSPANGLTKSVDIMPGDRRVRGLPDQRATLPGYPGNHADCQEDSRRYERVRAACK
jgi:hypothetical protein